MKDHKFIVGGNVSVFHEFRKRCAFIVTMLRYLISTKMQVAIREHFIEVPKQSLQQLISLITGWIHDTSGWAPIEFVSIWKVISTFILSAENDIFEVRVSAHSSHMPRVVKLRYHPNC
jgi:hypothetical protein